MSGYRGIAWGSYTKFRLTEPFLRSFPTSSPPETGQSFNYPQQEKQLHRKNNWAAGHIAGRHKDSARAHLPVPPFAELRYPTHFPSVARNLLVVQKGEVCFLNRDPPALGSVRGGSPRLQHVFSPLSSPKVVGDDLQVSPSFLLVGSYRRRWGRGRESHQRPPNY